MNNCHDNGVVTAVKHNINIITYLIVTNYPYIYLSCNRYEKLTIEFYIKFGYIAFQSLVIISL